MTERLYLSAEFKACGSAVFKDLDVEVDPIILGATISMYDPLRRNCVSEKSLAEVGQNVLFRTWGVIFGRHLRSQSVDLCA
jgi:hypothetical protein